MSRKLRLRQKNGFRIQKTCISGESQKCFQDLKIPLSLYFLGGSMEYDDLHTQHANACSKSTIEALEKDVYYVQS